ncbi:hypothetical protein AURDEDRAFT_168806 [Auricularia subglabra TFB-10046 SS5]|nr:hypothetical protein AURDEDRAFT_168806 [Auricularia subglabra TFB-10046 SS5]
MRIGPNGLPMKKKGAARKRRERQERYLLNHELNKSSQRAYAREHARGSPASGKPAAAEDDTEHDWIALGIHGQAIMLALWAGMRAADDSVRCPGLPTGVHHLHAGFMTFSHLYCVYEALFVDTSSPIFPLDRGDLRSLLNILERGGWLYRDYDGVRPDGVFGRHDTLLTVSLVYASVIEVELFGDEGLAAPEVKEMFKLVDELLQVAMMDQYRLKNIDS